jgi:cell division protein FtsQ
MALDAVLKWRPLGGRAKAQPAEPARARRSRAKTVVLVLSLLVILSALSLGLVAGYQTLLASPFFRLQKLTITGPTRFDQAAVIKLIGLKAGENLLKLDLDQLTRRLQASPWVERVSLRRVLPDELRVHLVDRVPKALLVSGEVYFLDAQGRPFKRVEAGEPLGLPVITGLGVKSLANDDQARQDLSEALELIDLLEAKAGALDLGQISEINYSPGRGAVLLPLGRGPRVILGRGGLDLKLNHWRRVEADLAARHLRPKVDYIDLRLTDKAFVGLRTG